MKRPVFTAMVALAVVLLGLLVIGAMTSGTSRIERTVVIQGSPERTWPFFADLRGWPTWFRTEDNRVRMTFAVLTQGNASGLDAIRHSEDSTGAWFDERVTAYEPNKRLQLTGVRTPGRQNWVQEVTIEPDGQDKTRITWVIEYQVHGPIMKLLNKARGEETLALLIEGGMKNIEPLVPTAEEWGSPDTLAAPTAPVTGAAAPTGNADASANP